MTLIFAYPINIGNTLATGQNATAIAIGGQAGQTNQGSSGIAIGASAGQTSQQANCIAIGGSAGGTSQGSGSVAIGPNAANTSQGNGGIAIGGGAGQTSQGQSGISIGGSAGQTSQGQWCIAIGSNAGLSNQTQYSIAIGNQAGQVTQGADCIAIGNAAGQSNQGDYSVAIGGASAGANNQGSSCVAIGYGAGAGNSSPQGTNAIAIGERAAYQSQAANSIAIDATGNHSLNPATSGFFVTPIRTTVGVTPLPMAYDTASGELIAISGSAPTALSATITTSSISTTDLFTVTIPSNAYVTISGFVNAGDITSFTDATSATFNANVLSHSGTASIVGSPIVTVNATSTGLIDVNLTGSILSVQVTAPSTDNYQWNAVYSVNTII